MKAYLKMGILSGVIDIAEPVPEIYIQWDGRYYKDIYTINLKQEFIQPFPGIDFKKLVFVKGPKLTEDGDIYQYFFNGVD